MNKGIKNLAKYFDARVKITHNSSYANGYSTHVNECADLYDNVVTELHQLVTLEKSHTFLEIGCGTGEILSRIKIYTNKVQGIDISEGMVEIAKSRGLDVIHYDGNKLPYSDDSFNIVMLYQVLTNFHSLNMAKKLLMEASRVLKSNGKLLIGAVPDPIWSGFPTHSRMSLRNYYRALRSWLNGTKFIKYFSYSPVFFLQVSRELNFSEITFSRCTLNKSGWDTKYHVIMEKN